MRSLSFISLIIAILPIALSVCATSDENINLFADEAIEKKSIVIAFDATNSMAEDLIVLKPAVAHFIKDVEDKKNNLV